MKRYITLIAILFIVLISVKARTWWNGNYYTAGNFSYPSSFSLTYDADLYGYGMNKEVFFSFYVEKEMVFLFSTRGSEVKDTYLQLYDSSLSSVIAENDGTEGDKQAHFEKILSPGKYYISVTKYDSRSIITMNIQAKNASTSNSIIDVGSYSNGFNYTDTQNTINYSDSYGLSTGDVTYNFTIQETLDIYARAVGCQSQKTKAYLLNSLKELISAGPSGQVSYESLPPGSYYVIVEGAEKDLEITTTISGNFHLPDNYTEVGTYNKPFLYSELEFLDAYPNVVGNELGDIVQRFTLETPMIIYISHDGSDEQNTAIHLWDFRLNEIANNNTNPSDISYSNPNQASMKIYLQPGIYYVVSESFGVIDDDYISRKFVITIEGAIPSEIQADRTQNYIYSRTMTNEDASSFIDNIQYFDGLGRPVEIVQRKANPIGLDLITYQEYDNFGRESNNWLPRVGTDGSGNFVPLTRLQGLSTSYYNNDTKTYSKKIYEESPREYITEQYGAGEDWHNNRRSIKNTLMTNIAGDDTLNCIIYKVDNEWDNDTILTLRRVRNYDSHQLYVTRNEDEDGNRIFEFKDKLGRLILNRKMIGNEPLDTYYIYNSLNAPLIILPPKSSHSLKSDTKTFWNCNNDTILQRYAFLYKYDPQRRQLCRAKKLPGCAWVFYMYDRNNRLIFTQDGNMRQRREWMFSLPDVSGRTCMTGYCYNVFNSMQTNQPICNTLIIVRRDLNSQFGYSIANNVINLESPFIMNVNYYDNYDFSNLTHFYNTDLAYNPETGFDTRYYTNNAVGLLTGSLTAILDGTEAIHFISSIMYYDSKGRAIQTKSSSHLLGGLEKEYIAYDFIGHPLKRKHIHSVTGKSTQTEIYEYTYDQGGRLLTTTHQLNGASKTTLVSNKYDAVGRLVSNERNGVPALKTEYAYNVRSWIKGITGTLFCQNLYYNDKRANNTNVARYNGNISGMDWIADSKNRGYDFSYDALSRLTGANYLEGGARSDKFDTSYSYDRQGNVLTLSRRGNAGTTTYNTVDNLTMNYMGNQLIRVEDSGTNPSLSMSMDFKNGTSQEIEYSYDRNGNMVKDLNKGISSIEYNLLKLPQKVTFTGANNPVNEYVYSAAGKKLAVIHKSSTDKRTDYVGNMIYENSSLKRILVDGGYIENGIYHFFLQDHLGNNRIVAKADGAVVQMNHYYPYGMSFAEGTQTSNQPYRYNGKEIDLENGLNLYDYEARQAEVATGRFTTIDPLAEKYYSVSPYVYCANNPVKYVDPDGKKIVIGTFWQRFMGALGLNSYIYKVSEHFKQNNMDNRRLESVYSQLEKSDFTYHVLPLSESPVKNPQSVGNHVIPDSDVKRGKKQGGTLYYDPEMKKTPSGEERNPRIALAHETGHLEDLMNGKTIPTNRKEALGGNKVELYKMELNEQNSLELENIIRAILNYENRDEYFKKNK